MQIGKTLLKNSRDETSNETTYQKLYKSFCNILNTMED